MDRNKIKHPRLCRRGIFVLSLRCCGKRRVALCVTGLRIEDGSRCLCYIIVLWTGLAKNFCVSIRITLQRKSSPIRLGIIMRALAVSANAHTVERSITVPRNVAVMWMTPYTATYFSPKRYSKHLVPYTYHAMIVENPKNMTDMETMYSPAIPRLEPNAALV